MIDTDPTDLVSMREAEGRAADLRRLETARLVDDVKLVMADEYGRRFVWGIIDRSGCNRPSFDPNYPDPQITAFNEGRRSEGLRLQALLYAACPALYDQMLRERATEQDRLKKELDQ